MADGGGAVETLQQRLGEGSVRLQQTADRIPTVWLDRADLLRALEALRGLPQPYRTLYDLTAIDERERRHRPGQPPSDFTLVYHLLSYERNSDLRLKVPFADSDLKVPTITGLWPAANWYEREAFDMFGIDFSGHPDLRRILMPPWWEGHPLRKEHPARATELGIFQMPDALAGDREQQLQFGLEELPEGEGERDFDWMILNMGPHHPSTHGVLRLILRLSGERIVQVIPDIGYHHRAAEKMGERQSWHTYIPYTDRVDYLAGVMNNFPYVLAVEALAGIAVPERARVIRIMLAELYRVISHLVFLGTFAQDLGMLSPVFYTFNDREHGLDVAEAITGARMHPGWFRIGGVADDLPDGWRDLMNRFLKRMDRSLPEYWRLVMGNPIFRARTVGVGRLTREQAIDWSATGPVLRACGMDWDWRKHRPYGGYDSFEFEVAVAGDGDAYSRAVVHMIEMEQSVRLIRQCMEHLPAGPYKSGHPAGTPPTKEPNTMHDIETLIDHFVHVSWGPVVPPGEAAVGVEATKGNNSYYLVSDGDVRSYRTRIRTPSFAHLQLLPLLAEGLTIADLVAILGSLDFVLADVDR